MKNTIIKLLSICISLALLFGAVNFSQADTVKNGIVNGRYYVDGVLQKGAALVKVDGFYYYIKLDGSVFKGKIAVTEANAQGLVKPGSYEFDNEGKMVLKNGIINGFYYVDNVLQKGAALVKYNGNYYYIKANGAIYVGRISISEANAHDYVKAGSYEFDSEGKMIFKNGFVNGYYYVNNELQKGAALIQYNGNYYYIKSNGEVYRGRLFVTLANAHNLVPAGSYEFDNEGKMIFKNGIIDGYYYVHSEIQKGAGLIKLDNDYYYIKSNGAVFVGKIFITEANAHGLLKAGSYEFGADGKLINSPVPTTTVATTVPTTTKPTTTPTTTTTTTKKTSSGSEWDEF